MTVEQLVPLIIMAFALGMDAFCVDLGMGMVTLDATNHLYRYDNRTISYCYAVSRYDTRSFFIREIWEYCNCYWAIHFNWIRILYCVLFHLRKRRNQVCSVGISLLVFAFRVSIDSFSVGLSLGIYGAQMVVTILLFGLVSMILAWGGLLIGRHAKHMLGTYGEVLGGIILVGFGLSLLFSI